MKGIHARIRETIQRAPTRRNDDIARELNVTVKWVVMARQTIKKHAAAAAELRENPDRSDTAISYAVKRRVGSSIGVSTVRAIRRSLGVAPKSSAHSGVYIPTQDEIKERCAEIRARWSEAEELKRRSPIDRPIPVNYGG